MPSVWPYFRRGNPGRQFLKHVRFHFPMFFEDTERDNERWDNKTAVESVCTLIESMKYGKDG